MDEDDPFAGVRIAGPEALLRGGMRMPPGSVVSHLYLVDEPARGEWFVDDFPPTRDEAFVRARNASFVSKVRSGSSVWVLTTGDGLLALPSHEEDRPVSLVFSDRGAAAAFAEHGGFAVTPEEIPAAEFFDEYLPAKIEDDCLIGMNWTPDLVGAEIEAATVQQVLKRS